MKTVCVISHGLDVEFARKLAEEFNVLFYVDEAHAYPNSKLSWIGTGFPEIKRIYDYEQYRTKDPKDSPVDIWAFPDVYFGNLQASLLKQGYKVYGAGKSERLELDKIFFLELLEKMGMPVIPYTVEVFSDLPEVLKGQKDVYLKRPYYRGDFETKHVLSFDHIEAWWNERMHFLGRRAKDTKVIVQQKLDAIGEFGYDGYNLDGQFSAGLVGPEIKDKGFIGKFFKDIPQALKNINDAMSSVCKRLGSRGPNSTEVRFGKDGKAYYIDPTHREPSPPGELKLEMLNTCEIVESLANGEMPEVKAKAKYGVQIILESSAYEHNLDLCVEFPQEVEKYVKLKNCYKDGGKYYCVPNENGAIFGSVIAYDDDLEKAKKRALKIAKLVKADEIEFSETVFDHAEKAINNGKRVGINIA